MAMTISEAQAVMNVLRWATGNWDPAWRVPTPEKARTDAMWLAERAAGVLGAGLRPGDIAEGWPDTPPADAATDLDLFRQAIEAWQAGGTAPHDVLAAIRDQLDRRVPDKES